ncbi:MAG: MarC family protein [Methyloceanibacter sp.]
MNLGLADIFVILFVTIGPLKAALVYAALTAGTDAAFKREVAIKTVVTSAIVIGIFIFAGEFLLQIFHISLAALKIAGGLILLLFALGMVMGEPKKAEAVEGKPSVNIAVYPLAMPLMATPQGIVAIVTLIAAMPGLKGIATVGGSAAVILVINLLTLLYIDRIIALIGPAALQIVARVVGLLLAALAVQLMIMGFTDIGIVPKPGTGH